MIHDGHNHVKALANASAQEEVIRWLAVRGYRRQTIGHALAWLAVHGTLATCPYIDHNHCRSADALAIYARETEMERITRSN